MPRTPQRGTILSPRHRSSADLTGADAPDRSRISLRHRGGLLAAAALVLSCGVTTALLAGGVLAAGSGLLGSPELTVVAALAPLLLLAWRGRTHLRRRRAEPDLPPNAPGDAMSTDSPYVCTLSEQDVPARTHQIRQLADGLRARHRSPGRVQLRFAGELADIVDQFVRDESACCSFFEFAIDERDDEVQLTVQAPAEAQPLLDSLHETLAAPQPDSDHTGGDVAH